MEVKVVFYNVLYEYGPTHEVEKTDYVSNFDNTTTLRQLFDDAGQHYADLSEYYFLSGKFSFNTSHLPFILNSNAGIDWNVSFQDAKVIDFISTHHIENNIIIAKIGFPQAGGPGFKELIDIWNDIYPVLDQVGAALVLGNLTTKAGKWVHSLFNKKDIPPQSYFDLIFSRAQWNHFEFAELVGITPEEARNILKLFGYRYDRSQLLYVQQDSSLELREKLSKINVLDI